MNYFKLLTAVIFSFCFFCTACFFCVAADEEKNRSEAQIEENHKAENDDDTFAAHLNKMEIPNKFKLKEIIVGNPKAEKTLIIYFSFTCPHCREFHLNEYPKFKKEFVDMGKIKIIFRNYIDDQGAYEAAQIVRCLCEANSNNNSGNFVEIYEQLSKKVLSKQKEWLSSADPASFLIGIFVDKKNGENKIRSCLKRTDIGAGLMLEQQHAMRDLQIISMPTFIFIDNKSIDEKESGRKQHVGSISYDELLELCDLVSANK